MASPRAVAVQARSLQHLKVVTLTSARRVWRNRMTAEGFERAWPVARRELVALLTTAQVGSAMTAEQYIDAVLAETGQVATSAGELNPRAFAGTADGMTLDAYLGPVREATAKALRDGASFPKALQIGEAALDMLIATALADTSRDAVSVGVTARPPFGFVRALTGASCARCTILAGRWYRWNADFDRHPHCDCFGIPAAEDVAGDLMTDPMALLRSGKVTGFSKANTRAVLEDGADFGRVTNSYRKSGMYRQKGSIQRIYRDAPTRDDAIAALKGAGYIR